MYACMCVCVCACACVCVFVCMHVRNNYNCMHHLLVHALVVSVSALALVSWHGKNTDVIFNVESVQVLNIAYCVYYYCDNKQHQLKYIGSAVQMGLMV